jgi:hypothetical protein
MGRIPAREIGVVTAACLFLCAPAVARAVAQGNPAPQVNAGRPVAAPAKCDDLVDQLLAKTGYSDALRGATEISRMEFQTGLSEIPNLNDADRSQANAAFARAFDPARLRSSVRSQLVSRCDAPAYKAVLASLSSLLALRMRRLEDASNSKAGAEALRAYYDQMHEHPPSEERVELLERLEKSRHEMEFLQNLLLVMARETAAGFGEPAPSDADIRVSLQSVLPMAQQMILLRELGVYRNAPDKDLVQYTAMWLSPAFQRFNLILGESFDAAFGTGVREAAQAVRPFLKRGSAEPAH